MPYINEDAREELNYRPPENAGELNFALTRMVQMYLYGDSDRDYKTSYQRFNDAMGALEGCKLELYRRLIAPYEDAKIEENGDVYE
jgi:hypothetical protein